MWLNVGKSINCIVAMVDRLQQQEEQLQTVMSPEPQEGDTNSQNTGDSKSHFRVHMFLLLFVYKIIFIHLMF